MRSGEVERRVQRGDGVGWAGGEQRSHRRGGQQRRARQMRQRRLVGGGVGQLGGSVVHRRGTTEGWGRRKGWKIGANTGGAGGGGTKAKRCASALCLYWHGCCMQKGSGSTGRGDGGLGFMQRGNHPGTAAVAGRLYYDRYKRGCSRGSRQRRRVQAGGPRSVGVDGAAVSAPPPVGAPCSAAAAGCTAMAASSGSTPMLAGLAATAGGTTAGCGRVLLAGVPPAMLAPPLLACAAAPPLPTAGEGPCGFCAARLPGTGCGCCSGCDAAMPRKPGAGRPPAALRFCGAPVGTGSPAGTLPVGAAPGRSGRATNPLEGWPPGGAEGMLVGRDVNAAAAAQPLSAAAAASAAATTAASGAGSGGSGGCGAMGMPVAVPGTVPGGGSATLLAPAGSVLVGCCTG